MSIANEETTYYHENQVWVTSARVIIGNTTYALSQITSVSMGARPANRLTGIIFFVVVVVIGACVSMVVASGDTMILLALAIAGVGAIVGLTLTVAAKAQYTVRIGSASGEANVLTSPDQAYIQKVVNAVNEATIKRR